MKLITFLDNKNGLLFHRRRQSQDRALRTYIKNMTAGCRIYMNTFTHELYHDFPNTVVCDDFLSKAGANDYCLLEDCPAKEYESCIRELIIFRWNKIYPADVYFDLDLSDWQLEETEEFEGYSHHITKERYRKEKLLR
ncbi:hypothetical protein [Anaerostipes sp.]|uniref:hypothetical protein n=1 Tax=Anaerostipes sp. TaxID=1872530 RepID=UPI0025C3A8AF|nr:hypothetical protein [Anaerostipes sp.]MBS7007292.1 hypothetical protein [Anaerostipes sp.]